MLPRINRRTAGYCPLVAMMATAFMQLAPGAAVGLTLWMTEKEVRAELINEPMQGNYSDGLPWQETYFPGGSIDYKDLANVWTGKWSFRNTAFCTFYNNGRNGGCWQVLKTSGNCYEFFAASRFSEPPLRPPGSRSYSSAQGWRKSVPSTCEPGVGV